MQDDWELSRQELRAQFAALQQLVVERTAEILAVIARHDEACAQSDERDALRNRPVPGPKQPSTTQP